jgi:hypothetical protein
MRSSSSRRGRRAAGVIGARCRSEAACGLCRITLTARIVITRSPRWLNTSISECTRPRSGFDADARACSTVTRTASVSPGRAGLGQRRCSMPGDATLDTGDR